MSERLDAVRRAIQAKDPETARQLLRPILKETPSAKAWYLAAQVANSEQRVKFLQNALKLDPTYQPARTALGRLHGSSTAALAGAKPTTFTGREPDSGGDHARAAGQPGQTQPDPVRRRLWIIVGNVIGLLLITGMVLVLRSVNTGSSSQALTRTFSDEDLGITLRYPEGWVAQTVDLSADIRAVIIANSQATLNRTTGIEVDDDAGFRPGEMVIMVIPRNTTQPVFDEAGEVSQEAVDSLVSGFTGFEAQSGPMQRTVFGGNPAIAQRVEGRLFDGYVHIIAFAGGAERALFGFVAKGEVDAVAPIMDAISDSLLYSGIAATDYANLVKFRATASAIAVNNELLLDAINLTGTAFFAPTATPAGSATVTPTLPPTWTPTPQ